MQSTVLVRQLELNVDDCGLVRSRKFYGRSLCVSLKSL